jgi:nucleoside-diphosphate-sugar epimerase
VRGAGVDLPGALRIGNIGPGTDWSGALAGCDTVVHLAARVHVMRETEGDPLPAFVRVNAEGTEWLARQAAAMGVRRFVFVSTAKVLSEESRDRVLTERDIPAPSDPYAVSKWQAELALARVAAETGLCVTVLRPPLVYGPGVAGNFATLAAAVRCGLPLPLASVRNRRSIVYVGNLCDAIIACLRNPAACGRTFLVSDGEDLSTPALLRKCAHAMGRPVRLLPCPVTLLRILARMAGKGPDADRLTKSLEVDSCALRETLGWHPPFTQEEAFSRTFAQSPSDANR